MRGCKVVAKAGIIIPVKVGNTLDEGRGIKIHFIGKNCSMCSCSLVVINVGSNERKMRDKTII
jgi:hypothetical protein